MYGDDMFGDEMVDEEDDEEEGGGPSAEDAPPPTLLHSVSHLLALDVCSPKHLAVAAGALAALEASPGGRARLGLLFNGKEDTCTSGVASAWTALASSGDFKALRRLLAVAHAAALGGIDVSKAVSETTLLEKSVRTADQVNLSPHITYAASLGLSKGDAALITNGRIVKLFGNDGAASLDSVDVALLEEYEFRQRAEGAAKLVSELTVPQEEGVGSSGDGASWRSTILMHTVAELSRVAQRASQQGDKGGDGRKVQLQPDDLPCGAACVRIPGEGAGAAMELVAILDPLSKQAQRLAPLLMELHSSLGLSVTVHLNPELSISEFPLENFYRYVVSLTPKFDANGMSLSPQTDHAIFASLRTPQVLTLHVDAPEAWLIEVTEAAYDMDNLRLSELGERKTVSARYELVSILITGSCETSHHASRQMVAALLGTKSQPHVTDTLVIRIYDTSSSRRCQERGHSPLHQARPLRYIRYRGSRHLWRRAIPMEPRVSYRCTSILPPSPHYPLYDCLSPILAVFIPS